MHTKVGSKFKSHLVQFSYVTDEETESEFMDSKFES